jgi:hypothetical protein
MVDPHKIVLKGRPMRKEETAGGAVTPGHLIRRNTSGQFVVHNVAAGKAAPCFAGENEMEGEGITTAYAANDRLLAWFAYPGCEIYALVPANAPAIVIGDFLESNGDGTLRKCLGLTGTLTGTNNGALTDVTFNATWSSAQANEINSNFEEFQEDLNNAPPGAIATALEALDNSAGGSPARLRIEIL